jgi:APA family basic amino acid/polyamine antiporter
MAGEPARGEPQLGAFDAAMVVVSLVIGIGIFRTPAMVAAATGSAERFFGAWVLCGLVTVMGALTYAEIGSRLPRTGGYYRVVAEAYHPVLAFMLNWAQAVMQGAGAAGVSFIGAEYLLLLLLAPSARTPGAVLGAAMSLMLVLLLLNFLGLRTGARTQNVLSLLKIAMIVGVALSALLVGAGQAREAGPSVFPAEAGGFVAAAVACFYTYGGYQMAMNLGGDLRRPRRSLPLAICGGMGIVIVLYLLINAAYYRALGLDGLAGAKLAAAALARATLGPAGEAVVSALIFLSAAGFVNATILQMPRSYYAMAEDGALPAAFRRVRPRTQVPEAGLAFFALTMLGPAFWLGSFEKLLGYVMFTDGLTLAVVASTLFVLRHRGTGGDAPGSFRVPFYPVLPAIFTACLLGVSVHVFLSETRLSLAGLAILLAGWPLFRLARRLTRQGPLGPASVREP